MNAKDYLLQYHEYNRIAKICLEEYNAESKVINGLFPYLKKRKADLIPMVRFTKGLKARAEKARNEMIDILDALNKIPEFEREILYARYIEQMKWDDMTTRFCYSWHGIFQAHDRAIRMLQEVIDEKETPLQI